MTMCYYCTCKKNLPGKNNEFPFYPQYFSTFGVLDIDVPTTDLLLRKRTQHHGLHLTTHKYCTPYDMYDSEKSVTLRTAA